MAGLRGTARRAALVLCLAALGGIDGGPRRAAAFDPLAGWQRKLPPYEADLPVPNAWDLYLEAAALYQPLPPPDPESWTPGTEPPPQFHFDAREFMAAVVTGDRARADALRSTMEEYIRLNQPALDLIHQAWLVECVKRPTQPADLFDLYDQGPYRTVRELADVEAGRAALLHLDGRDAEAFGALEDTFALGVRLGRGAGILDDLFGAAVVAITVNTGTRLLVQDPSLPAERLLSHARVVRQLREQRWPISRTFHFDGDQMLRLLPTLPSLFEDAGPDRRKLMTECTGKNRERVLAELPAVIPRLDGWLVELVRACEKHTWEIDFGPLLARLQAEGGGGLFPLFEDEMTAADLLGPYKRCVLGRLCDDARLAGEEVAALLAAYRVDRGEYPATLDALVPDYTDAIPPDPWTGKPVLYRREGPTDYVLYCTGPDKVDSGGVGDPWKHDVPDFVLVRADT